MGHEGLQIGIVRQYNLPRVLPILLTGVGHTGVQSVEQDTGLATVLVALRVLGVRKSVMHQLLQYGIELGRSGNGDALTPLALQRVSPRLVVHTKKGTVFCQKKTPNLFQFLQKKPPRHV